jgi:hypothetical protein
MDTCYQFRLGCPKPDGRSRQQGVDTGNSLHQATVGQNRAASVQFSVQLADVHRLHYYADMRG